MTKVCSQCKCISVFICASADNERGEIFFCFVTKLKTNGKFLYQNYALGDHSYFYTLNDVALLAIYRIAAKPLLNRY
jgi:hypothetical protein